MLIGELEGDVSTDRLTFEAFKEVEQFDFVTVKNPKEGQEWILAQVDTVTKSPDGKTTAEAQVIGFREDGMLKQPRHVVKPESMVYRADEDVIAETLGLTQDGLYMGRLDTNPDIRIFIDPEELYKHIAVLAKTGAGKSYATGVMIEELLEQDYPVLIVDPHGEYHSLAAENDELDDEAREAYGIDPATYDITEYSTDTQINQGAEKLRFSSKNMDAKELEQLVPTSLTNSQLEVLYNALKDLKERDYYDLQDVIDTCMQQDSKAKWNLVNILEVVQDSNLFGDEVTQLGDLVEPGKASIVNLKGVEPETQEMVVYKLAKELFDRRKVGNLDPFVMVLEEAHNFVPERNFGKAVCSDVLRTIASEGRKFGLGLGVVSQRPARVDKNILSQCNTQLILRVTNPNDLNAIGRSFEGVTSEVKDFITSLPPGTALLLGKEYPVMTDIRTRRSKHGGGAKELSNGDRGDVEEPDAVVDGPAPGDAVQEEPGPASDGQAAEPDADQIDPAPTPEPSSGPSSDPDPATATGAAAASAEDGMDGVPEGVAADAAGEAAAVAAAEGPAAEEPSDAAGSADDVDGEDPDGTDAASDRADSRDDGRITAIDPVIDFAKLRSRADTARIAYYPLWVVETSEGTAAVDATDGEVKATKPRLSGAAADAVELLQRGERSRGELVEALDVPLSELDPVLATLEEAGLIAADGDTYRYAGVPALDRDRAETDPGDHTVIDREVDGAEAERIAVAEVGGEVEAARQVYYPYFTASEQVFDAVRGEEV